MKKINCRVTESERENRHMDYAREKIQQFNGILEKFATEDGFDEYCKLDTIKITIGNDEAETYFSPETWETIEHFIMVNICFLIESNELDKFPLYDAMIDKYSKAAGIERGNFTF